MRKKLNKYITPLLDLKNSLFSSEQSRSEYFTAKYLSGIRFKGDYINFKAKSNITRLAGLVCGSNVTIEPNTYINATAGISFGNNSCINRNTRISSVTDHGNFDPVVIGSGQVVKQNLSAGSLLENLIENKNKLGANSSPVFVLSTGRSGSKAIVHLLNQHSELNFYHDSIPHINKWSIDLLYKKTSYQETKSKISTLYDSLTWAGDKINGQSDQKLVPMVPILIELYPNAKFIWLIREADTFVNSSYPRGWFDNHEFGLEYNKDEFFRKEKTPSDFDATHRINGGLLEQSVENWKSMSAFERNCWYWSYWNELIENSLSALKSDNWISLKLNDLESSSEKIQRFLGVQSQNLKAEKINTANYKKLKRSDWTTEMETIYINHCGDQMKRWFN